jgi:hypothetical protein
VASKSEAHRETVIGAEILSQAALQQHQLDSVLMPERPTAEIVGLCSEFIGRPISKWSGDPDLAQLSTTVSAEPCTLGLSDSQAFCFSRSFVMVVALLICSTSVLQ